MEHPELFSPPDSYDKKCGTLQPIYPLTAGMTNNAVAKAVKVRWNIWISSLMIYRKICAFDIIWLSITMRSAGYIFHWIRQNFTMQERDLYFEEFLVFVLALRRTRERNERAENGFVIKKAVGNRPLFIANLPYELTGAQKRVWNRSRRRCAES